MSEKNVNDGTQSKSGEFAISVKLHHKPSPELEAINKKIDGIYLSRGTVCANFPHNTVATFLLYEKWLQIVNNDKYDKQELTKALPTMFREAITVLPKVKVLYFDKDKKMYFPFLTEDGSQLVLHNVLFRQGYNLPFGLVTTGPYAGLILRYPSDRPFDNDGISSKTPNVELSIERIMNDGMLNDKARYAANYKVFGMFLDINPIEDVNVAEEMQDIFESLSQEVEAAYNTYIEECKQNGEPLNAIYHVQKFCKKYGFPYNEDEVNYRLAT